MLNGCAAIVTAPSGKVFGGTRADICGIFWAIPNPLFLLFLIDLPFSMALDVVLLPTELCLPPKEIVTGPYGAIGYR